MKMNAIRELLSFGSVVVVATCLTSVVVQAQKSSGSSALSGTSWQLVKFQGPDERTFSPDDKSKYTITFGSNGRVTIRVDCNRGSSTWKATAKGELQFGSWSRTTAKCGAGSLHDQIVTEGADRKSTRLNSSH